MKTFLGMPIRHRDQVIGSIYLTEKSEGREFTLEDENIIAMFATQTAMAVSNALNTEPNGAPSPTWRLYSTHLPWVYWYLMPKREQSHP